MEKEKAEILSMTDKITKLPDNVALFFVDRIAVNLSPIIFIISLCKFSILVSLIQLLYFHII